MNSKDDGTYNTNYFFLAIINKFFPNKYLKPIKSSFLEKGNIYLS